ncbi:MAG: hypothetical protein CMJ78_01930 [Planctomycetaceae bacterium]|nr:hypothetical protein [Planctomycetaceae bacterium]
MSDHEREMTIRMGIVFILLNVCLIIPIFVDKRMGALISAVIISPLGNLTLGSFAVLTLKQSKCFDPGMRLGVCFGAAILFSTVTFVSMLAVQ